MLPGDLIFTGTPSGVGMGRRPPEFLRPGMTLDEFWAAHIQRRVGVRPPLGGIFTASMPGLASTASNDAVIRGRYVYWHVDR